MLSTANNDSSNLNFALGARGKLALQTHKYVAKDSEGEVAPSKVYVPGESFLDWLVKTFDYDEGPLFPEGIEREDEVGVGNYVRAKSIAKLAHENGAQRCPRGRFQVDNCEKVDDITQCTRYFSQAALFGAKPRDGIGLSFLCGLVDDRCKNVEECINKEVAAAAIEHDKRERKFRKEQEAKIQRWQHGAQPTDKPEANAQQLTHVGQTLAANDGRNFKKPELFTLNRK